MSSSVLGGFKLRLARVAKIDIAKAVHEMKVDNMGPHNKIAVGEKEAGQCRQQGKQYLYTEH
jgi:hypothetical protein